MGCIKSIVGLVFGGGGSAVRDVMEKNDVLVLGTAPV